MTSPTIAALRAELEAQKAELALPLEGMRDYVRIGNGVLGEDAMRDAAEAAAGAYVKRIAIIDRTLGALYDLELDGYPDVPAREVPAGILAQLDANLASLTAARTRFTAQPEPATDGSVRFGTGTWKRAPLAPPAARAAAP